MTLSILATSPCHERRNMFHVCEQRSVYQPAQGSLGQRMMGF